MLSRTCKFICAAALLAGCSSDVSVSNREVSVLNANAKISGGKFVYGDVLKYGTDLTNGYLEESVSSARARNGGFVSLLALGVFAGYRAVDGAGTVELAKTAVFGAAANQGVQYVAAGPAAKKIVKAAERTSCVVNAGVVFRPDLEGSTVEQDAAALMLSTLDTIRVILRQELSLDAVDYSTIADNIEAAAKANEQTPEPTATQRSNALLSGITSNERVRSDKEIVADKALKEMKVVLSKCPTK